MDPIDSAIELLTIWGNNFKNNSLSMFYDVYNMFAQRDWIRFIRIIALLGGYMLLRAWLMKGAAKKQEAEHAKELEANEIKAAKAKISPNVLRGAGGKKVSFEDDDTEEDGEAGKASGNEPQWGKKARKRQRQVVKKLLEIQEEKLRVDQEDEEDKDIMELLVDYEEGKDGW